MITFSWIILTLAKQLICQNRHLFSWVTNRFLKRLIRWSLEMETTSSWESFWSDFCAPLIVFVFMMTSYFSFSRIPLRFLPIQGPDATVDVLRSWIARVPHESMQPCHPHGICLCLNALFNKYGSSAWDRIRRFYLSQYAQAVDERSSETIQHVLDLSYQWFFHGRKVSPLPPRRLIEEEYAFNAEVKHWKAQFPGLPYYLSENFYHHHGLRFVASASVRGYLRNKDFLDLGASVGDSLVILKAYTTARVVSYELIPNTYQRALRWTTHQCLLFNMAIASETGVVYVPRNGGSGSNIRMRGSEAVKVTTVDQEAERLNLTVGLIKADIEGTELPMLIGARKTIQRDRPILSLTIYHGEQLLDVPEWISELPGYRIQYFFPCARWAPFFEYSILACPDGSLNHS
jgi:FkbM family methyltransferase